ncbi:hypothetical protein A499_06915 [Niallia nealsonii AAU1]|nr:hypothetical protein A499_06915 [Niallia nealsonii AAU1]
MLLNEKAIHFDQVAKYPLRNKAFIIGTHVQKFYTAIIDELGIDEDKQVAQESEKKKGFSEDY